MAPKLYILVPSPPVRSVMLCAAVLDIDLNYIPVDCINGEHLKEPYVQKCPQHTVPLLEEQDGFLLADSHAIMTYLVAKYGKDDSVYPKNDLQLRAKIDHLLHFDSSVLFVRGLNICKPLLFANQKPTEDKINHLKDAFQIADAILAKNNTQYAVADHITVADFSFITTLTAWDVFVPVADYPNLKNYVERIEKLSWYKANTEGLEMLKQMIADKKKELA